MFGNNQFSSKDRCCYTHAKHIPETIIHILGDTVLLRHYAQGSERRNNVQKFIAISLHHSIPYPVCSYSGSLTSWLVQFLITVSFKMYNFIEFVEDSLATVLNHV